MRPESTLPSSELNYGIEGTTMIYAKAGDIIKRCAIEKLKERSQDSPKMVPPAHRRKELEGETHGEE